MLSCSLVQFVVCKSKMLALPLIRYALFVVVFLFATEVWSSCIVLASHLDWSFEWQWQSGACISQVQGKRANLMILLIESYSVLYTKDGVWCENEVNVWLVWLSKTQFLVYLLPTKVIWTLKIYWWKVWLRTGAVAQCMM